MKTLFFPKTAVFWSELPSEITCIEKHEKFKHALNTHFKPKACKVFNYGHKYSNMLHTQLRLGRSQLNEHLYQIGLSETKGCLCGAPSEDTNHYLLDCFLFENDRSELLYSLNGLLDKDPTKYNRSETVVLLLRGELPEIPGRYEKNTKIFNAIQKFIIKTNRLKYKSPLQLVP